MIERQADACGRSEMPDLSLLSLAFQYFQNYPDLLHHPKEDALYDRLIARDPAVRREITNIRTDHQRLAAAIDAMADEISDAQATGAPKEDLGSRLRRFVDHYRLHMTIEEAELFPRARTQLEPADWELIEEEISPAADPLFDGSASRQYARLFQELLRGGA